MLPHHHKALLSHCRSKFERLRRCISANSYFIFDMLQAFQPPLDFSQDIDHNDRGENIPSNHDVSKFFKPCQLNSQRTHSSDTFQVAEAYVVEGSTTVCNLPGTVLSSTRTWLDPSIQFEVPFVDFYKVRCIIRNIVRDWAAEGQCYRPILDELDSLFAYRSKESPPACLVPGAGLGRLALEISSQVVKLLESGQYIHGSTATVIHFQMMTNFILFQYPIFIPLVQALLKFIMIQAKRLGCSCHLFFIDTAHNIVEYIEIISRILKDGGVWINMGPLLYHFADVYGQGDDMSIELSLEDVKRVALHYGFCIEKEATIETTYTTNPKSMMQNRYYAAFWTMRKKSATMGHITL